MMTSLRYVKYKLQLHLRGMKKGEEVGLLRTWKSHIYIFEIHYVENSSSAMERRS